MALPWWATGVLAAGSLLIPYFIQAIFPAGATQAGFAFKRGIVSGAELLSYFLAASLFIVALYGLGKALFAGRPSGNRARTKAAPATPDAAVKAPAEAADVAGEAAQEWSLELLQSLSKGRFKTLCRALFEDLGLLARESDCGADLDLYAGNSPESPVAIAKCKASSDPVNAGDILEFCGIVDQTGIGKSYFATASSFTEDARNFSETCDVSLISGLQLLRLITSRSPAKSAELFELATGEAAGNLNN
ncbi:Restriction endonuclease [Mariprofundus ferrinatatus]|uniref:Restriction endonuclease n=1 Tax=Mariprofundus ferrinatatus TaxID=1921087 RepID=A0A2K8L151_9PROT|nr:Restriction endonuclease [Mariprofundus ferrinatatus]